MFNLLIFLTILAFWLGTIWLYFFFDRLLDDVRELSKELDEIRADFKTVERDFQTLKSQSSEPLPDDRFLGI